MFYFTCTNGLSYNIAAENYTNMWFKSNITAISFIHSDAVTNEKVLSVPSAYREWARIASSSLSQSERCILLSAGARWWSATRYAYKRYGLCSRTTRRHTLPRTPWRVHTSRSLSLRHVVASNSPDKNSRLRCLGLYHNCDSTTTRLRRKIDMLIFSSRRIASNGSRRARYVVVGSMSYCSCNHGFRVPFNRWCTAGDDSVE